MPLTTQQIANLLQQARNAGLSGDDVEALEWYLVDRAAELDGATRLDAALAMLPQSEAEAADAFMSSMATLRKQVLQRGADELRSISDDEWGALVGEGGDNASAD